MEKTLILEDINFLKKKKQKKHDVFFFSDEKTMLFDTCSLQFTNYNTIKKNNKKNSLNWIFHK